MLPVSAWPPGPPGSQLSPFGLPRTVNLARHPRGYVLPKGTWVVQTGSNQVVMYRPPVMHVNPARAPGTGILPGQGSRKSVSRETCAPCGPPGPQRRLTHDQYLESWRAWQRKTGRTDPPIRPTPGRVPPNFFGWGFVNAPATTLIPSGQGGTVQADGQNVVIVGAGSANITEAF